MSEHHGHVLGQNMREAVYINLGLLALKKCIEALNRKVSRRNSNFSDTDLKWATSINFKVKFELVRRGAQPHR